MTVCARAGRRALPPLPEVSRSLSPPEAEGFLPRGAGVDKTSLIRFSGDW